MLDRYDFYLISQHVGQGTVTPTHYNVIEDTFKDWSPDKMQQVTYKLTHMYFNWSVSDYLFNNINDYIICVYIYI
jgi:hypothetical protein